MIGRPGRKVGTGMAEGGGAGPGVGVGRTGELAEMWAGLVWLMWMVRRLSPSWYWTCHGFNTLLMAYGPVHFGANLLVRSGGVVRTQMKSPGS